MNIFVDMTVIIRITFKSRRKIDKHFDIVCMYHRALYQFEIVININICGIKIFRKISSDANISFYVKLNIKTFIFILRK